MTTVQFNLNQKVRVRLTEHGRNLILRNHLNLFGAHAQYFEPRLVEEVNGWSEWQLWDLMREFGQYTSMGAPLPFDPNIELFPEEISDLEAKKECRFGDSPACAPHGHTCSCYPARS